MYGSYRFFFFSREETRKHIHVSSPEGEVKFEPEISVEKVINLSQKDVNEILSIIKLRKEEIDAYWNRHFNIKKD